ncbi:MAG: hypothetical protein BCS36_09030 [Desulfovibrio sp. MES5]|uniref:hypothetical protein n=1 Tax=Desulfovibrio sp. MES5 TaxID=1899016 RepID=UPI000B9D15C9|nr:hypothetical protein [Desulfovibrio sp. MES5]OXS28875.1 MAG: hypothetical protein BCS36_09030 [Desulfovibrio sp. MES5]
MQSSYVVHAIEGRARLRHPALADVRARGEAQAVLRDEKDVNEVRFGSESILLLMNPGTDFAAICQRLEEKIPDLLRPKAEVEAVRKAERRSHGAKQAGHRGKGAVHGTGLGDMLGDMKVPSFLQPFVSGKGKGKIMGISPRKFEVRTMLGAGSLCLLAGFAGGKGLHVAAGLAWATLATRHVWVRRKAL